jgi:hypothetical protein
MLVKVQSVQSVSQTKAAQPWGTYPGFLGSYPRFVWWDSGNELQFLFMRNQTRFEGCSEEPPD